MLTIIAGVCLSVCRRPKGGTARPRQFTHQCRRRRQRRGLYSLRCQTLPVQPRWRLLSIPLFSLSAQFGFSELRRRRPPRPPCVRSGNDDRRPDRTWKARGNGPARRSSCNPSNTPTLFARRARRPAFTVIYGDVDVM